MPDFGTIVSCVVAPCAACDERIRSKGFSVPKCRRYLEGIPKEIILRENTCPHFNKQTTLCFHATRTLSPKPDVRGKREAAASRRTGW